MATRIAANEMTSDLTRHTALAAEAGGWTVTWLPGRTLTQSQAVTAMTIAEAVAEHVDDLADNGSPWWLHIDGWGAELGITGPEAVAHASRSPEDHADMPRVRVVLPEPGPVGYLLDLDQATGKATVRIDGATLTMDAARLQYCAIGAALAPGDEAEAVWAAPADGRGNGPLDLTRPERLGLIDVMTDHERSVLLAFIAGYAPEVFDDAIASRPTPYRPEGFAAELLARVEERDQAEYLAEPEGYCTVCGANVSHFFGYEGPHTVQ
jgi:hypothetical protein